MSSSSRDAPAALFLALVAGAAIFFWVGKDLYRGIRVKDIVAKATSGDVSASEVLRRDAEKNHHIAFALAYCHWSGGCAGIAANPEEAMHIWSTIVDKVPEAGFNLGLIYELGLGGQAVDLEKARVYYQAAVPHVPGATYRLARLMEETSPQQARDYYMQVAMKDTNPQVAYKVGWMHYRITSGGHGLTEAAKWFKRAAQTGLHPDALFMMGHIHMQQTGLRTLDDRVYAAVWYLLAAERDHTGAYRRKVEPFVLQLSEQELAQARGMAQQFISSFGSNVIRSHEYNDILEHAS